MWTVYYHQNKENGKLYIGITSIKPEHRWGKEGHNYSHSPHFLAALNKYGWDGFYHEIFASGLTKEEAENMERILIEKFDTKNPEKGYNVEDGGFVKTGVVHSSETAREAARERFKSVRCEEDNKVFETIADAAKFYNISRAAVRRSAQRNERGAVKVNRGLHFTFI